MRKKVKTWNAVVSLELRILTAISLYPHCLCQLLIMRFRVNETKQFYVVVLLRTTATAMKD
jgi:hypothetical protein